MCADNFIMFALLWRILDLWPVKWPMPTHTHTLACTECVSERRRGSVEGKRQHQADRTLKAARTAANRTNLMCEEERGVKREQLQSGGTERRLEEGGV